MSPRERKAREDAVFFRQLAQTEYPPGHVKHRGTLAVAARLEEIAAEEALADLDPSADVCGWSAVAALAGEA